MRSPAEILEWIKTPTGRTAFRYSVVSAISIFVSQVVLFVTFGVIRLGTAMECNVIATAAAAGPSYYLNRNWAWGRSGTSHFWKEVVPFWVVAFFGLAFSIVAVDVAERLATMAALSHLAVSIAVNLSALAAYGVLWVGKFVLFHKLLFGSQRDHELKSEPVNVSVDD